MPLGIVRRPMTVGLLMAGAAATPYAATETQMGRELRARAASYWAGAADRAAAADAAAENPHHATEQLWETGRLGEGLDPLRSPAAGGKATASLVGGPVEDLRDLLRFDATPEWVTAHFTRVSTVLAELQLDGLRVPVVTGTEEDDLAGTLTYYFDRTHRVQRITLHAMTGDPARLADQMTRHYGMEPQRSLDAGLYTINWNGKPTSVLKITHAPVMYADAPRARYTVFLELNQPNLQYGLSEAAARLVAADKHTWRW